MTAATLIRPRTAAVRKQPSPPVYERPRQEYVPNDGASVSERIDTLRATLHMADEKLEAAYDAADPGTAVDTLLNLVAHDLVCKAMHPVLRNEDEATILVTKADLAVAYEALFPVLAVLEGAMALSIGTVLSATLVEAFQLLNWAQEECDSAALGALLPPAVAEKSTERVRTSELEPQGLVAEATAVILAASREHGLAEIWAVHSLVKFVDSAVGSAGQADLEQLEDASAMLEQVLALLQVVNSDDIDCMLLAAGSSLLGTAKRLIDDKCAEVLS